MGVTPFLSIGEARKNRQYDSTSWKQGDFQHLLPLPLHALASAEHTRTPSFCNGFTHNPWPPQPQVCSHSLL